MPQSGQESGAFASLLPQPHLERPVLFAKLVSTAIIEPDRRYKPGFSRSTSKIHQIGMAGGRIGNYSVMFRGESIRRACKRRLQAAVSKLAGHVGRRPRTTIWVRFVYTCRTATLWPDE
jgi:hypothetical protein